MKSWKVLLASNICHFLVYCFSWNKNF